MNGLYSQQISLTPESPRIAKALDLKMANYGAGGNSAYIARFDSMSWNERFNVLYGDLNTRDTTQPQDRIPSDNRTLPFSNHYKARNRRIEMVLLRLLQEEDMFPCRVLLPMAELGTGQEIIITRLKFEPTNMEPLPQEGVVQNVSTTYSTSSYKARTFGNGFAIQHAMLNTEVGFLIYSGGIMQIETAIKNDLCVTAYEAILSANQINAATNNVTAYQILSVNQDDGIVGLIEESIFYWGCLTKTPHGFRDALRRGEDVAAKRGVKFDTSVWPHNTSTFLTSARPELNNYATRGPDVTSNNLSYSGYVGETNKVGVYESALYRIEGKTEPTDPTARERFIGEFFESSCRRYLDVAPDAYKSQLRSLTFINEKSKQLQTLSITDMVKHCTAFNEDGSLNDVGKLWVYNTDKIGDYLAVEDPSNRILESMLKIMPEDKINAADQTEVKQSEWIDRAKARIQALPINRDTLLDLIKKNIPVPMDFRIARPFMRYVTTSGFMMQKGAQTGNSFYGDPEFTLTIDGTRKVLHGSHSCVIGAKVYDPDRVFVFPNVFVGLCQSGGSFDWFDHNKEQHINGFNSGENEHRSLFCIPIRPREAMTIPYMDMSGKFPDQPSHSNGQNESEPHFAVSEPFNRIWQFVSNNETYYNTNYFAGANMFSRNTLCCQGAYIVPKILSNGVVRERGELIQGRGHWGAVIYNGVCEDRAGRKSSCVAPLSEKIQELINSSS